MCINIAAFTKTKQKTLISKNFIPRGKSKSFPFYVRQKFVVYSARIWPGVWKLFQKSNQSLQQGLISKQRFIKYDLHTPGTRIPPPVSDTIGRGTQKDFVCMRMVKVFNRWCMQALIGVTLVIFFTFSIKSYCYIIKILH